MFGAAAAIDDGNTDPGTLRHKQERLPPCGVESRDDVGDEVIGVLDTG